MRVLVLTKLFPSAAEPHIASFNRQQLSALGKLCDVTVLATLPWFPGSSLFARWSAAGRRAKAPRSETIAGLPVIHPKTLYVPRLHGVAGALYAASVLPELVARRDTYDVLLGCWAYPDGAATVALGQLLGVPAVVKVHGSDLNVVARMPGPRRNLAWAMPRASRIVAVSRPLGERARELGAARVDVVGNGVDVRLFHPRDRAEARRALGLPVDGRWIVYVGRLEREKGVLDLIEAMATVAKRDPAVRLALVGDGASRAAAEAAARPLGDRVLFAGAKPLAEVPTWVAASDVHTLPSWNEGTPNVVLEALASGRRVVASDVGGIPDVMTSPALGRMVPAQRPDLLAEALVATLREPYEPADVVREAGSQSWEDSARLLLASLLRARADATGR